MKAMRDAIMKRRMKLAGDVDYEDRKNANLNPDEGSQDDLTVAQDNVREDIEEGEMPIHDGGLAPDISAEANDSGGEKVEEVDVAMPEMEEEEEKIHSFFSPDDVGKPGIRGKAASKMAAALKNLRK